MAFELKHKNNTSILDKNDSSSQSDMGEELLSISNDKKSSDIFTANLEDKTSFNIRNKFLNSIIISSEVVQLIVNENSSNSAIDFNLSSIGVLKRIDKIAEKIISHYQIEIQPKFIWKRNLINKIVIKTLNTFHKQDIEFIEDDVFNFIISIFPDLDSMRTPTYFEDIPSINDSLKIIKLSFVSTAYVDFFNNNKLFRNDTADLNIIFNLISEATISTVKELLKGKNIRSSDLFQIYRASFFEAYKIFKASWNKEEERVQNIINEYPVEKIQKFLDRYKEGGGFPLEPVFSNFTQTYSNLKNLVTILAV